MLVILSGSALFQLFLSSFIQIVVELKAPVMNTLKWSEIAFKGATVDALRDMKATEDIA